MTEKILTLHPQNKQGVNIDRSKYDMIRTYIIDVLKKTTQISYQDLNEKAIEELSPIFDGKVAWYLVTVKLDLEARKVIKRIPKTSPHEIKLCSLK